MLDRSNMQIFTLNITRVVWPHVPSSLDLRYFCRHNPLSYDLKLVPGHYWSWQRIISFLVNIFVRHTFSMSKSSIKTETVLTMTDTTEPTELLVIKISMCISVALSYQPFPNFFFAWSSFTQIAGYNQEFLLSPYSWWFCFFFWTTQVCWKVSNSKGLGLLVKKYSIFVSSQQCPYMIFIHP